eukprot:TRINITY_DN11238_c0_g1_i1.p1 TRINITY_DN11238_c0_g1~~TRINITY_DN11238_c0_g1_i1.p1  ORF type:complete len:284 (+),score=45.58 TRINITY_DN11238_c0_g1_i1:350-1201(+)
MNYIGRFIVLLLVLLSCYAASISAQGSSYYLCDDNGSTQLTPNTDSSATVARGSSSSPERYGRPELVFNDVRQEYFMAFLYSSAQGIAMVYGQRLDTDGQPIDSAIQISPQGGNNFPVVAYDNINDRYLVAYTEIFTPNSDGSSYSGNVSQHVYARYVLGNGTLGGNLLQMGSIASPGIDPFAPKSSPNIAFANDSLLFAVTWVQHLSPSQKGIALQFVDDDVVLSDAYVLNPPSGLSYQGPDIAYNQPTGEFILAFDSAYGHVLYIHTTHATHTSHTAHNTR